MKSQKSKVRSQNFGFTLIEALVLLFIFSVVTLSFYSTFSLGTNYIMESKNRLGAAALANAKMEIVRGLDYDAIGTRNSDGSGYGVPAGEILDKETITVNTRTYYVFTTVQYFDDAHDGAYPDDTVPNDYKKVRIKAAWEDDQQTSRAVVVVATFPPPGIEVMDASSSVLSVNVLNNEGAGVPQAILRVVNTDAGIDTSVQADSAGNYTLIGVPEGNQNYEIWDSKSGYYSVNTFPPYPTSSFDPVDNINASVVVGSINTKTLIMGEKSNMTIASEDFFGNAISGIDFNLKGGWKRGMTVEASPVAVYAFDQNSNTGVDGQKRFENESFGMYYFSFVDTANHKFIKMNPSSASSNSFDLTPGADATFKAVFADKSINSVLVTVKNSADSSPVASASVRLQNTLLGYDATVATDAFGFAYFPTVLPALAAGNYDLAVSASGFQNYSGTVSVSGLVSQSVSLDAN